MKLLIVEDEEDLREALCYGLEKRGYAVDAAETARKPWSCAASMSMTWLCWT